MYLTVLHFVYFSENLDIQSRALGNLGRTHVLMGRYNRALDMCVYILLIFLKCII